MGVIKKVLYRGEALSAPKHRNLFLDMEENIHIHYRDLRIELSRKEFEDIARIFKSQADELLTIIQQTDYHDGRLPNANSDEVRIWTQSTLANDVKYHPRRISIEECRDGYHLHYRNYKLLIEPNDFRQLTHIFRYVDLDGGYAQASEEVLSLLDANHVDFTRVPDSASEDILSIAVARYHLSKVREIFSQLGFAARTEAGEQHYQGTQLLVKVRPETQQRAEHYQTQRAYGGVARLADVLTQRGKTLDVDELNHIKCQVLDLYYALRRGQTLQVDVAPQHWLYIPEQQKVIFPYQPAPKSSRDAEGLYRSWTQLLESLSLYFIKPSKAIFDPPEQTRLQAQIRDKLQREIASCGAVTRLWLMGSIARNEMGVYAQPFVHGKLAKIGSDIDILIEMDPRWERHVPRSWQLIKAQSSNYCSVYHLSEIELTGPLADARKRFPHVKFTQHLIDAYVFFPSNGHAEEKDAFLNRFGARLLYDRQRDGIFYRSDEEASIARQLRVQYHFGPLFVEKMEVSTDNGLFRVFVDDQVYVLKQFKLAGNYRSHRLVEHTAYETALINHLHARQVPTAAIIPTRSGSLETINDHPAVLFEWLPGNLEKKPEYQLAQIARALAHLHQVQINTPLDLPPQFHFEEYASMWLAALENYTTFAFKRADINAFVAQFVPLAQQFDAEKREKMRAHAQEVHCHGDVAPKNIMMPAESPAPLVAGLSEPAFFDFNNAFFGPRLVDVIDGGIELSLAEKYIEQADFRRFDDFLAHYCQHSALTATEQADLDDWILLISLIMFTKEIRVLTEEEDSTLREQRALGIAHFITQRLNGDH